MAAGRHSALVTYAAAILLILLGVSVAVARFPGGFDWAYTVVSKLASRDHNPDGGAWLSAGLLAAMVLLWPATGHLGRGVPTAALRVGLAGAALLALEGLFMLDFSGITRKGHELLALVTLVGLYAGVLGLYLQRIKQDPPFLWPALLILFPLLAIGASQLALYFDQRDLGWVNTGWRAMGVPVWLSFAFWQWLAIAVLGAGLGHLIATRAYGPPGPRPSAVRNDGLGAARSSAAGAGALGPDSGMKGRVVT